MTRKELRPEDVTAIVDSREQLPYTLYPLKTQPTPPGEGLPTGDYTIRGLEHLVTVERKSLDDFLMCVGQERERFEREMQRILAYPERLLVVEASRRELGAGGWRSRVTPAAAVGSYLGWMARGIPIHLAGNRETGDADTARFLFTVAKRHWRELQAFSDGLKIAN